MLSMNEPLDSPFESTNETSQRRTPDLIHSQSRALDSENEENQTERRQFLRSMSSNIETSSNPHTPAIAVNSSGSLAMADDATQLLLTRLGIVRRKFFNL